MDSLKGWKTGNGEDERIRLFSRKMTNERAAPTNNYPTEACDQCIPMNIKMIRGAWTQVSWQREPTALKIRFQIYGNPKVVNKVFGTVMSLENMKSSTGNIKMTNKKTSCVGMEIGSAGSHRKSSKLNLFFRDSEEGNELHEVRHLIFKRFSSSNSFRWEVVWPSKITSWASKLISIAPIVSFQAIRIYQTLLISVCLVKSGPSETDRLEYIVLAETTGKHACR